MTVAVGIVAVIFFAFVALGVREFIADAGREPERVGPVELEPHPGAGEPAGDRVVDAQYLDAWQALRGRAARLALLAVASDELAQRCRGDALTGRAPSRLVAGEGYCWGLPAELRDAAARPGGRERWQALDRALQHLSAVADSDDAAALADAHERVSIAARALADALGEVDVVEDLDHCWFCGRSASEVERLLYSSHAAICGDCVQACHERLHEL